jgi:hypothetical protein
MRGAGPACVPAHQGSQRQPQVVRQPEQSPDPDAVAVVPPGVVEDVGLAWAYRAANSRGPNFSTTIQPPYIYIQSTKDRPPSSNTGLC